MAPLRTLDMFFFVFHTAWIVFVLVGWSHPRTRRWHLAATLLTVFSWLGLGYWYGWGYCPCTDWHWQVREAMGHPPHYTSYTRFLVESLLPVTISRFYVDAMTVIGLVLATATSVLLNIRALKDRWATRGVPEPRTSEE
ncbi:MAG: DUF2784 domain-containing protein [Candidatus Hydrogenedentota bacterium]